MSIIEYLLGALGLLLIYITYFIIKRDTQQRRKIDSIASSVEETHRQIFALEKKMRQEMDLLSNMDTPISREELHLELERSVQRIAEPVAASLEGIEHDVSAMRADLDKRIHQLEDGLRSLSMPSQVSSMDDAKIIKLFKQGSEIESIAKELHLSKPEVEFVLKINKIR